MDTQKKNNITNMDKHYYTGKEARDPFRLS